MRNASPSHSSTLVLAAVLCAAGGAGQSFTQAASGKLVVVDATVDPDLFMWTDTTNVYVLRSGDAAILINLGDASVLDHLGEIGVKRVEWVLYTDHHREQSQGHARMVETTAKVAGPEAERALFEKPSTFRKMRPKLNDPFTVHGASYVRPPVVPIHLDRGFSARDVFTWQGREILCLETKGNSPGGMSYAYKRAAGFVVLSGDVMLAGARMHTFFDSEWDYGFAAGIHALAASAAFIERFHPRLLLPAHGPRIVRPADDLSAYQRKLRRLAQLVVRGYDVGGFDGADQDPVSTPTAVPHVWQVTPHVFKFRGAGYFPNFGMILADSGHALVVDAGGVDQRFLDRSIELMQQRLGLKQIDAVLVSHMHGDHFLNAPHLRDKWGAKIWVLDRMADQVRTPLRFDYGAAITAYNVGFDSLPIDRVLPTGGTIEWEGYRLTADWMPGQTKFAMGLHGRIDGKTIVFTGDNIFGNPRDPRQTGHEALVARNSGILEEGYIEGAALLQKIKPDLIVGGHSYIMDKPAALIDRYRHWALDLRSALQQLSPERDYRPWFDPYWIRSDPYRVTVAQGASTTVTVQMRNFAAGTQRHQIALHMPFGLKAFPATLDEAIAPDSERAFPVTITASKDAAPGVHIVAFDITKEGKRFGELFDFIVEIRGPSN